MIEQVDGTETSEEPSTVETVERDLFRGKSVSSLLCKILSRMDFNIVDDWLEVFIGV